MTDSADPLSPDREAGADSAPSMTGSPGAASASVPDLASTASGASTPAGGPASAASTSPPPPAPASRHRPRSRLRKLVSRYSGYVILRIVYAVISRLPLEFGRLVARIVGTCAYFLLRSERRLGIDNLTRAFGAERSPPEIRAMCREVFRNMAMTFVEGAILGRITRRKLLRRFPELEQDLLRIVDETRRGEEGGIGLTGHFGNWELISAFVNILRPGRLVPVAKRVYFPKYQEFLHSLRSAHGNNVIYTDDSPRQMIRLIREGNLVSFLPDMDVRSNSAIFVDFFGRPTYTVTSPMDLARRLDVPWCLALLYREGKRFRLYFSGAKEVPRTCDPEADARVATQEWTRLLEEQVRLRPTQWAWIQGRWRSTPEAPRLKRDRPPRHHRVPK